MRDEHQRRVGAERLGLRFGPLNELGRCYAYGRNATRLKVRHVMRTARNARASIAQAFDDEVDFGGDLLLQRDRRWAGIGRLRVVLVGDPAFAEPLSETVQEHVAARFSDIENADRQSIDPLRPR